MVVTVVVVVVQVVARAGAVVVVEEKEDVARPQFATNYQKIDAKKAGVQVGGCLPGPPELKNRISVGYR